LVDCGVSNIGPRFLGRGWRSGRSFPPYARFHDCGLGSGNDRWTLAYLDQVYSTVIGFESEPQFGGKWSEALS
jgi:hypothetical protein